ncbi:ABC transporter substrate-binding protein [Corynebacterium mendelii]|uniref:Iron-siderophore ABC transporter substrate-binding protein n=1 Tax=Corynebacterium mendelii TaxID=2765362 RepID=A0A939DZI6_9CORY|nr:iron-siderophore ABC transporter substrate-binding protein [Corynebacterium mendelii]MBN9643918.1 iron-siderophore ABC transporter substrate-binding protein [Corynebacterium mendelii]
MRIKLVAFAAASALGLSALAACSSAEDPADSAAGSSAASSAEAVTSAAEQNTQSDSSATTSAFPVTIEHFRGTTTIPAKPERVVVLDNSYLENIIALGDDSLVGYASFNGSGIPPYATEEQKKLVADAVDIGDVKQPNLEMVAALRPDLILSSDYRSKDYYDKLSEIAPTVYSEKAGTTWRDNLLLTGQALGKQDKAQEVLDTIVNRAHAIGDDIRAKGDMPTVSIVRLAPNMRMFRDTSFPGSLIKDIGLPRPDNQIAPADKPEDIFTDFSEETVGDIDADLILYMSPKQDSDRYPAWQEAVAPVMEGRLWNNLAGEKKPVWDRVWYMNVSPLAAPLLLDDVADMFDVDNHRES